MSVRVWEFIDAEETPSLREIQYAGQSEMTMNDISRQLPPGGYTTFRTYGGDCAVNLKGHFNRLEETARLAGSPVSLPWEKLRRGIRQALETAGHPESRVRISVDMEGNPGAVYLMVEPLVTPAPECYEKGVAVSTTQGGRANARAKLSDFITVAHQIRAGVGGEYEEVLLVNEAGDVLEGLTSNFFAVDGRILKTAGLDVLFGITRSLVIDLAREAGLGIQFDPVKVAELGGLSEAFITSSSRGILPVSRIDEIEIGPGRPGEVTRTLMKEFDARTGVLAEEI